MEGPQAMVMRVDRSRLDVHARCEAELFWQYYYGGRGVVPKASALPLIMGSFFHTALEGILKGEATPEEAIASSMRPLREGLAKLDLDLRQTKEQCWLAECLVWSWVLFRLPTLKEEFEFLLIEQEILWELGDGVEMMMKPDVICKRRDSGELFYMEWKTTSQGGDEWSRGWERNGQVMCNVLALKEALKVEVSGVMIEGIIKGPRKREFRKSSKFNGKTIQDSPFCYMWETLDGTIDAKWKWGAEHVAMYEGSLTPKEWVQALWEREVLQNLLAPVPTILPVTDDMEAWRAGALTRASRIKNGLKEIQDAPKEEKQRVSWRVFPRNDNACYRWRERCACWELCFGDARRDPLGHGFIERLPHHATEFPTDDDSAS